MAKVDIQLGQFKNSILIFKIMKNSHNVYNYYMYLQFEFHDKRTKDTKVISKKPSVQGQGDKKKGQVFLAITHHSNKAWYTSSSKGARGNLLT